MYKLLRKPCLLANGCCYCTLLPNILKEGRVWSGQANDSGKAMVKKRSRLLLCTVSLLCFCVILNGYNKRRHADRKQRSLSPIEKVYINIIVSLPQKNAELFKASWSPKKSEDVNIIFDAHSLEFNDEFPPYKRHMAMWEEIQLQLLRANDGEYTKWVSRCDYDTHLKSELLVNYLRTKTTDGDKYLGVIGTGREHEREYLNLKPFAMGGGCEIVLASILKNINFDACRKETLRVLGPYARNRKNYHSDAEFGRCLHLHGISPSRLKVPYYFLYGETTIRTQQKGIPLCRILGFSSKIVIAHPIKDPIHLLLASQLQYEKEAFEPECTCDVAPLMTCLPGECSKRCISTYNPCKKSLKRHISIPSIHILGFNSSSRIKDVPECLKNFYTTIKHHIPVDPVFFNNKLTRGERSYLASMHKIFKQALNEGVEPFLVLEEDFLVHRDLCTNWQENRLCVQKAMTDDGVYLFGHTTWNDEAWPLMTKDACPTELLPGKCYEKNGGTFCLHGTPKTLGSFANLYSLNAARFLLFWIEATKGLLPFDHAYAAMLEAGNAVRISSPPLIIADVSHVSTVNPSSALKSNVEYRHKKHKWGPRSDFAFNIEEFSLTKIKYG